MLWVKEKWPLVVLVVLFAVSVVIRFGAFSTSPQPQYTATRDRFTNSEVYLHTGYVFSVYSELPFREHKFLGYVGKSDKFLQRSGLPDMYVYSSFPPTLFVVPFLALTFFGTSANLVGLDIFNLGLQLLSVVLLYYLILELLPPKGMKRRRMLVAMLGASAYIFATGTLQYHLSVYWAHELLQPVLIGSLLWFARRKGLFKWWEAALVGFGLSVVTWTGVFGAVGMAIYALWKFRVTKDKGYLRMIFGLAGGSVLAVVLIVAQVLVGTGADFFKYFSTVFGRVESRTLANQYYDPIMLIRNFVIWLFEDYGAYILIAYTFVVTYIRRLKPGFAWAVVAIAALPCIESFILVEHDTVYGFGRLKWLTPVILIAALMSYEFLSQGSKKGKKREYILIGIFAAAAIFHVLWYLYLYSGTFGK